MHDKPNACCPGTNVCRQGKPACAAQHPFNASTLLERELTILRSIASGNNACGSLMIRGGDGDFRLNEAFIREAIRPTLDVYEREAAELRQELLAKTALATALERESAFIAANHPGILEHARRVLAQASRRN